MNFLRNMEAGQGGVDPTSSDQIVARAQALVAARAQLDPATHPPDPAVIDMLAPEFCLDHHVLP